MNSSVLKEYNISRDNYYAIGEVFGYYLIPLFSIFGFMVNSAFAWLLLNNDKLMKQRKYRILAMKSTFVLVLCKLFQLINH